MGQDPGDGLNDSTASDLIQHECRSGEEQRYPDVLREVWRECVEGARLAIGKERGHTTHLDSIQHLSSLSLTGIDEMMQDVSEEAGWLPATPVLLPGGAGGVSPGFPQPGRAWCEEYAGDAAHALQRRLIREAWLGLSALLATRDFRYQQPSGGKLGHAGKWMVPLVVE